LGEDLTGGGLEPNLRQMVFSTGLKGIAVEEVGKVEDLIFRTLASLVKEGIDPAMIEASINTIEFQFRENNTGPYPRGLILMLRTLNTWLYDGDPLAPLMFEIPLQAIKDRLALGERYFEDLIRTYLLENAHRSTVLLTPDSEIRQHQEAAERERLIQAQAAMTPEECQAVIDNAQALKRLQETPDSPEALATLPMLTLGDLERQNKLIPLTIEQNNAPTILYHDLFTNGIIYLDIGFDLHVLPQELLPYVPLFGQALVEIGTETEDFVKISQRIGQKTGGIWPSRLISAQKQESQCLAWLFLRGKATMEHADDLLTILRDLLLTVKLDNQERFKQIVLESKAAKETSLIPHGHGVVNTRLAAHFGEAGWVVEQMGGVESIFFIRHLAEEVERHWPEVLQKLDAIKQMLINRQAMLCNVTLDETNWTQFQPKLRAFLEEIPVNPINMLPWMPQPPQPFEGLTTPARVNYVGKGANVYDVGYRFHGSVLAILNYLRTTWLWERVRVRGGAYGGFCTFDRFSGLFSYLSYRDPNLLATIEIYDQAAQFLQNTTVSDEELTKSIIGAIGQIDAYQLPDAKGYTSMARHLLGISDEERQQIRDELLAARPEDFKAFGAMLQQLNKQGLVVVMGSKEAIDEANAVRNGWLNTLKVL
jgi:Zn-dependent M16 (insulinase) family peptidase